MCLFYDNKTAHHYGRKLIHENFKSNFKLQLLNILILSGVYENYKSIQVPENGANNNTKNANGRVLETGTVYLSCLPMRRTKEKTKKSDLC